MPGAIRKLVERDAPLMVKPVLKASFLFTACLALAAFLGVGGLVIIGVGAAGFVTSVLVLGLWFGRRWKAELNLPDESIR